MTYKELQKTAKELGLPFIGIPKAELEESIRNTRNTEVKVEGNALEAPTIPEKIKEEKIEGNTAIILDGNREIRRYSIDVHGPGYANLAKQFIVGRKYTVKYVDVKMMHTCPACGHKYDNK